MSDKSEKNTEEKNNKSRLGLKTDRLELRKTIDSGTVRQSFSHGRTKSVSVEIKKVRTYKPQNIGTSYIEDNKENRKNIKKELEDDLSDKERDVRLKALDQANKNFTAKDSTQLKVKSDGEKEKNNKSQTGSTSSPIQKEDIDSSIDTKIENTNIPLPVKETDLDRSSRARKDEEELEENKKQNKRKLSLGRDYVGRRSKKKLSVHQTFEDDDRQRSLASVRRARERERRMSSSEGGGSEATKKIVREVIIPEVITVQELANRMAIRSADVVKALMKNGVLVTANQNVDGDTAELVVIEFGHTVKRVSDSDVEIGLIDNVDNSKGKARAPIVTIMGHVDHGKTSLLDAIRATDVVGKESGGITQHIGAYQIETTNQQKITFIDTPGHAAFSSMRARGANITDIIVLVVAADDSVMPQTIEAIQHAKEASVPIVLAINKIDVEGSNPTKVKQDLLQHDIVTEDMGGEVVVVEVSAIKKKNLDELIESILLQAELLDLKAVYEGPSSGVVLESRVDIGRGIVSNILVSRGTLKIGDIVVAGANWGKVRALMNDKGERIDSAEPTVPVEVLGLNDVPQAGDQYAVVDSEYRAREVANYRKQAALKKNNQSLRGAEVISADQMLNQIKEGKRKILPIILKTDVHGSMEAINSSLKEIEHEEVAAQVVLSGVGALNESDLMLALTSNAVVMGFNVRADMPAKKIAKQNSIEIKYYSVIYELIDDVKNLLSGLMAPIQKESFLGYASIKKIFKISKVGKIAGCEVTEGTVKKGAKVRLLRDNVVIHEGDLSTLKHHQNEVKEVKQGVECGMSLANYDNIKEGDLIECFEIKSEKRTL